MTKAVVCTAIFTLVATSAAGLAGAQTASEAPVPRDASSPAGSRDGDCAARIDTLDDSTAEGEERLAEKYKVISFCADQYAHDATIKRLVNACTKYAEQPVVKQQFLAECQLAAFKYANALRELKAEYGK